MILDIHTHHAAPQPNAVISVSPDFFSPVVGQKYSVGIHPWDTQTTTDEDFFKLEKIATRSDVVAIGETGIDKLRGGALYRQMLLFKRIVVLSENLHKPLVIHDVKAHDIIVGLHKEFRPEMPWAIHGFRGKPGVAEMLVKEGLWLSFGPNFNQESIRTVPLDRILAETDDADVKIEKVIDRLSEVRGESLLTVIENNTNIFLS